MERCVILSAVPVGDWAKELIQPTDYIIACDAGYRNAESLDVVPNLVLGDFDSAPEPEGNPLVLPTEKNDTDTHYAARLAVQKGFGEVLMLGALGGERFEHSLANLSTGLWLSKQGVHTELADRFCKIQYVLPDHPVELQHDDTMFFSLFPMDGKARGITITGAKYSLQDAELCSDYPLGVSNETKGTTCISLKTGSLLLILTKKERCREQ